jgi:hypothetical protein
MMAVRKRETANGYLFLVFGIIPAFYIYDPLKNIKKNFSLHSSLDVGKLDQEIERIANKIPIRVPARKVKGDGVAILATEICDMGGHTECIKNMVTVMPSDIASVVYLTKIRDSERNAVNKIKEIRKRASIDGIQYNRKKWKAQARYLFNKIYNGKPRFVVSFLHMDDAFGAVLLSLLKRKGIKILYFNHGSHYPALGMRFADVILEGTKTTERITNTVRGHTNTLVVGLPYLRESSLPIYSDKEIVDERSRLCAAASMKITMSGASSYKFFDAGMSGSPYFEMIRRLLERNADLTHVLITNKFSPEERNVFDGIFGRSGVSDRIVFKEQSHNYKILFKCADVFIDSFPVSSALTQVDLISLGVPNVVKINRENPMWSFHEYMPENYPYAFADIAEMEQGIQELLDSPEKRRSIAEANYRFFLERYEGDAWVQRLLEFKC